jgi:hypothetical protein
MFRSDEPLYDLELAVAGCNNYHCRTLFVGRLRADVEFGDEILRSFLVTERGNWQRGCLV